MDAGHEVVGVDNKRRQCGYPGQFILAAYERGHQQRAAGVPRPMLAGHIRAGAGGAPHVVGASPAAAGVDRGRPVPGVDRMNVEWSGPLVAALCTISMLVGWLTGHREQRQDADIIAAEDWHQHCASAAWVARRSNPDAEVTQQVRP